MFNSAIDFLKSALVFIKSIYQNDPNVALSEAKGLVCAKMSRFFAALRMTIMLCIHFVRDSK